MWTKIRPVIETVLVIAFWLAVAVALLLIAPNWFSNGRLD